MKLHELGEFGLIEMIREKMRVHDEAVVVGLGDDAAAIRVSAGNVLLLTIDALVEGVHFDLEYASFRQVGWRAMASNVSDIAAMGGRPGHAVVSVGLSAQTAVESVKQLYAGLQELGQQFGVTIVGGDTVSSPHLFLSLALTGWVEEGSIVTRSGASPGHRICVTGHLGRAQAGLELLRAGKVGPEDDLLVAKHLAPLPRVREARVLVENFSPSAMIDISDGMVADLRHIAQESGVGARLIQERIPVAPDARRAAAEMGKSALDFALYGGEEFELLFTLSEEVAERACRLIHERTGTPVFLIGEVRPREEGVTMIDPKGRVRDVEPGGYEHFSS